MIDLEFLQHLKRLSLLLNKKVTSNYVGERASPAAGRGLVLKDHIPYTWGDDFRSIDWRIFARTDKLFVKRYEEERNLTLHIIQDMSASMDYGDGKKKSDYASMIGIGFAFMALRNNERFVLSTFSEKLEIFKPKKGAKQLASITQYLNHKRPKGMTKFSESLEKYKKHIDSRSLIIIISDFLYEPEDLRKGLARYKDNMIKLIQVLDRTEMDLNFEGDFMLEDLETHDKMKTYISPLLKKKYSDQLSDHIANVKRVAAEVKAEFYTVSTGTPIFDTMFRLLQ
jgi:uncharacterized protein (DUF58 family)